MLFSALQKFDVTHNDLKKLPKKLGELRKLQFLYAQHNDIEELPDFDGCEHLEQLYLGNNFIKVSQKYLIEVFFSYNTNFSVVLLEYMNMNL